MIISFAKVLLSPYPGRRLPRASQAQARRGCGVQRGAEGGARGGAGQRDGTGCVRDAPHRPQRRARGQ
eukprot:4899831-Prymnesium_polylepis.1